MPNPVLKVLQVASLVVTSLLVGSMFGIWRGFNPATFSPATFVEVQQGAIHGLNDLLPIMGLVSVVLTLGLAFLARRRGTRLLYGGAAAALILAGAVTRLCNQPINDIVMSWSGTPPEGWQALRDSWWSWHIVRLAAAFVGELFLINAVLTHVAAAETAHAAETGAAAATRA
jgi:hypothetical protein